MGGHTKSTIKLRVFINISPPVHVLQSLSKHTLSKLSKQNYVLTIFDGFNTPLLASFATSKNVSYDIALVTNNTNNHQISF